MTRTKRLGIIGLILVGALGLGSGIRLAFKPTTLDVHNALAIKTHLLLLSNNPLVSDIQTYNKIVVTANEDSAYLIDPLNFEATKDRALRTATAVINWTFIPGIDFGRCE